MLLDWIELMTCIPTTIIGHEVSAKCSLTGKDNTECFAVCIGNGKAKYVAAGKLVEILRWNCSITVVDKPKPPTVTVKE